MFKKTIAILIPFAVIAVLAFGVIGSGAWFTDSQSVEGNYVTTGSLDLVVSGGPFIGVKLEPGAAYQSLGWFCVENVGDYDMKWRGWIYEVTGSTDLSNYLLVKAILNPAGHVGNYGPADEVIFEDIPFSSLVGENSYIVMNDATWPFAHGYVACYDIQAKLLSTAPNTLQNSALYAKFYIQGTQRINTGWGE